MSVEDASPSSALSVFPFVMVLSSVFARGSLFLCLGAPTLRAWASGTMFDGIGSLVAVSILGHWEKFASSISSLSSAAVLFVIVFSVGLILTPLEWCFLLCAAIPLRAATARSRKWAVFSSFDTSVTGYPEFLSRLIEHPHAKLHWEWQLFLYHLYWTVFFNSFLFVVFAMATLRHIDWRDVTLLFLMLLPSLLVALAHSVAMARVHRFYHERFESGASSAIVSRA